MRGCTERNGEGIGLVRVEKSQGYKIPIMLSSCPCFSGEFVDNIRSDCCYAAQIQTQLQSLPKRQPPPIPEPTIPFSKEESHRLNAPIRMAILREKESALRIEIAQRRGGMLHIESVPQCEELPYSYSR